MKLLFCLFVTAAMYTSLHAQGWVRVPFVDSSSSVLLGYASLDTCYAQTSRTYYRSIDGGYSWEEAVGWYMSPSSDFCFYDASHGALAPGGGFDWFYTTDAGRNWNALYIDDPNASIVYPVTSDTSILLSKYSLVITTDNGKNWTQKETGLNSIENISFYDSRRGVIVGDMQIGPTPHQDLSGACATTSDGGVTWIQQYTGTPSNLIAAAYPNASTIIGIGSFTSIVRSLNGGITWDSISISYLDIYHQPYSIASRGGRSYIGGADGLIVSSTDRGATWQKQFTGVTVALTSIKMADAQNALAAGARGVILRTTDGGTNWVQVAPHSATNLLLSVSAVPETPFVQVKYELPQLQGVSIEVVDVRGRVVLTVQSRMLEQEGEHAMEFSAKTLSPGIYFLRITTERFQGIGKFVVVK